MNNKPLFLFLACCVAFSACKKSPVFTNRPLPSAVASAETLQIPVDEVDFQYFSAKSKINYQAENEEQSATINIRMKKDSLIWLSVNKVGIEGFRTLITRDSIYIQDKLHDTFMIEDFQSLSKQFNFPITFDLLQSIILGNLPFKGTDRKGVKAEPYNLLKQQQGNIAIENFIRIDNRKLEKVHLVEQNTQNSLTLNYANFGPLNASLFPYSSAFYLKYATDQRTLSTLVTIECNKAEISDEELKFPFKIPKRYERK